MTSAARWSKMFKFVLDNKLIENNTVKWGNSMRNIYISNGKNINIKVMENQMISFMI